MILDAILDRRSIRFYRDTPVSNDLVEEILKAGFAAPTAHASARWHVVVVRDREIRERLSGLHKWSKFISRAPVALVVCCDISEFETFWVEDASAFLENALIQATQLGLGSCWVGVRGVLADGVDGERLVRQTCDIPETFGVLAVASIGYAARNPGPHDPTIPQGRVHRERYRA